MQRIWRCGGETHGVTQRQALTSLSARYNETMATVDASILPEQAMPLLTRSSEGRARFTREAYHRLADAGILNGDTHVELIDGEIFMMLPIGPPQGSLISRLTEFFAKNLRDAFHCRVQLPIAVGNYSEPEPDLAVVR